VSGEFGKSVVPHSLCAVDRSLKANLMHAIEEVIIKHHETAQDATAECKKRVLVDAKAMFQGMKKNISDLLEIFIICSENLLDCFNEGRIVFGRYIAQSLKIRPARRGQ